MAIVLPKFPRRSLSPKRRVARRREPALGITLLALQPRLEPNELLEFEYRVRRVEKSEVERLEVSVIWFTEGKGSEDFGVHYFDGVADDRLEMVLEGNPTAVCTTLPASPLSYEGNLLKIRWCIRLRLYMADGRQVSAEQPFHLGHLTVDV